VSDKGFFMLMLSKFLHLAAAIIWLGGMVFVLTSLRPVAIAQLQPSARLTLLSAVLVRFFMLVWASVVALLLTGLHMLISTGMSNAPKGWHWMLGIGLLMFAVFTFWDFNTRAAVFASALCLATSPAITIATCSDVGAKGERTGLLYTMVAINGGVAFTAVALMAPFLTETATLDDATLLADALGSIGASLLLGGVCAGLVLLAAGRLGRQVEHQHLLILGCIVLGVGTAIHLEVSVFLPMLIFGILVQTCDREQKVVAIRIAGDARVFMVVTFVLAGAALDVGYLQQVWPEALLIALIRLTGQFLAARLAGRRLGLSQRESLLLSIGLQPMSSVALVLLVNTQTLYSGIDAQLTGTLLATILLMQLFGPLATQTAIKGFGEAQGAEPIPLLADSEAVK